MSTAIATQTCPRCGNLSDSFVTIDPGMKLALQAEGENLPDKVCSNCFELLTGTVSQGMKLRLERDVREKNKMLAWKSRVNLIKNARGLMNQKAYSEAAVQYEKYVRVLEVVYNIEKGALSPAVFNNSSRSKELTVIASVYWDLVRIYDTSPRYGDRMQRSASKLAEFLQYSPIYPDILKKAEHFSRNCKNPQIMRQFLRQTKSRRGPCFVASAAFADDPCAVELSWLRQFRDQRLRPSRLGRQMIWIYYRVSPPVARWIGQSSFRSLSSKWLLVKMAHQMKKSLKSPPSLDVLSPCRTKSAKSTSSSEPDLPACS
jgi:hypothetical protein